MTSTKQESENDLLDIMIQVERELAVANDDVEIVLATLHLRNALALYQLYGSLTGQKRAGGWGVLTSPQ